jgi:hypothetical protein
MRRLSLVVAFGIVSAVHISPSRAEDGAAMAPECNRELIPWNSDTREPVYKNAVVIGEKGERAYFFRADHGCPNEGECQQKAYLIPGDEVILTATQNGWSCGHYQSSPKKPMISGLIRTSILDIKVPQQTNDVNGWFGKWNATGVDAHITISKGREPGTVEVLGEATYGSGDDLHDGEFLWEGRAQDQKLVATDKRFGNDDCKVNVYLVGNRLIAYDNNQCGGRNVSFYGVYFKDK